MHTKKPKSIDLKLKVSSLKRVRHCGIPKVKPKSIDWKLKASMFDPF